MKASDMPDPTEDIIKKLNDTLMKSLLKYDEIELENITMDVEELELRLLPTIRKAMRPALKAALKPIELARAEFTNPKMEWTGQVAEVRLGATASEGGTREKSFVIGGETTPPFYLFEKPMPHTPVIAMDVFDMKIHLPKAVRNHFGDVLEDPPEWAKRCVEKYNADMVNLHLISTDPYIKDTSPADSARLVEQVLQAVKVPICVGGSGNPTKDVEVFEKVCEVASGERLLLNSVNLDMDLQRATKPIKEHGHVPIAFTQMDLDKARELNRRLYDYLPKDRIVMDTNCSGIGYGLEFGFTIAERARLAALKGDTELQQPIAHGISNAWAAREAWLQMDPIWGSAEIRGPIWETITALSMLLVGTDYFMMLHPTSVKTMKEIIGYLSKAGEANDISNWVSARLGA